MVLSDVIQSGTLCVNFWYLYFRGFGGKKKSKFRPIGVCDAASNRTPNIIHFSVLNALIKRKKKKNAESSVLERGKLCGTVLLSKEPFVVFGHLATRSPFAYR